MECSSRLRQAAGWLRAIDLKLLLLVAVGMSGALAADAVQAAEVAHGPFASPTDQASFRTALAKALGAEFKVPNPDVVSPVNDFFGASVALSGDTAVVGANGQDNKGAVYVFVRNGSGWSQQAQLTAADGAASDLFGTAVALSGDTLVVSAFGDDVGANVDQGSAYVFVRSGGSWSQQAQLTAADGAASDQFGLSVAVSGDTAVVGTALHDVGANGDQGSAYVYLRNGSNWSQQAQLTATGGAAGDLFGTSVAVSGDTAMVGARGDDVGANVDQGSVYVYLRNGSNWSQQAQLTAADGGFGDGFGSALSVSGDTLLVGAFFDDIGANSNQGSAYVFVGSGSTWSEQAKLIAADGEASDNFGFSVAVSGDTAVVGAFADNVVANNNQGSAWEFVRSGSSWSPQAQLIASDGAANDLYGRRVALSETTALVAAPSKDLNAGAVYFYEGPPTLSIDDVTLAEGNSGTSIAQFTVTRSSATTAFSVDFATADGSAADASDYVATSGTLEFAAGGAATATILVSVNGDSLLEPDETFVVNLGNATGGTTIADAQGVGTITNDDVAGALITRTDGANAVTEAGGTDTYTIVLGSQPTATVNVAISFPASELTVNGDSDGSYGTSFTNANWDTPQTITIGAVNDRALEGDHAGTLMHAFSSVDAAYNGITAVVDGGAASNSLAVAIGDNESALLEWVPASASAAEGASNAASVRLDITADPVGGTPTLEGTVGAIVGVTLGSAELADLGPITPTVIFNDSTDVATIAYALGHDADSLVEGSESYELTLALSTAPLGTTISAVPFAGTITDADSATVAVSGGSAIGESVGSTPLTVTLTTAAGNTLENGLSVAINLADGTATYAGGSGDYFFSGPANTATVNFPAGAGNAATQSAEVSIREDVLVEGTEGFGASLGAITGAATAAPGSTTVTITDNDTAAISFQAASSSVGEAVTPHSVTAELTITAVGSGTPSLAAPLTVAITQTPGTATPADYVLSTPSVTFAAASTSAATQPIAITIVDDTIVEGDEGFTLGFGAVTGSGSAAGSHVVTIIDNDSAVVGFALASISQPEATSPMVLTVSLSNPVASGVTLNVNTAFGTASAADFTPIANGTVSFPASSTTPQSVQVVITNDALDEDDESFSVTLSNLVATGDVTLGTATVNATILDNDATPTLSITSPNQPEGNAGPSTMNFTVSLSAVSGSDVSFSRTTADGSATVANADYVALAPQTLTIPAGSTSLTIPVTLNGDTAFEGNETFSVNLTGIVNASPGTLSGTGTIQEDDQQPTTTTITSDDPDPSVVGQPYTVSVNVAAVSSSPLGTVTVSDGAVSCGPVALATATSPNSTASCVLTSTTAGAKNLVASYTPASTAFAASVSVGVPHQVNAAATTISVSGPPRSRINQPTTFTFALGITAPGAGTPTGSVTLTSGAATCTATLPATSCNLSFDVLGSRIVTASYGGDANFNGSTSSGAANAQTLVYALSDLVVTKNDGVGTYAPGELLVYSVIVRNLGPDAAVGIRIVDSIPAGLTDVVWSCDASGGVACPVPGGSGNLDVVIASFPVDGLLNFTFFGNVLGTPAQIANTATLTLPADTTVEDPVSGNNSATDIDLADGLFANGFEDAQVNAAAGSFRIPGTALRGALDEVALRVYVLDDVDGEALRVYARVIGNEVQYALATRNAQGRLRLAAWRSFTGDPTLSWTARAVADGWALEGAELR